MLTVSGNSAKIIAADGTVSPLGADSGQVYDAVINGVVVSTTLTPMTFDGQPYYPFNLDNLDIAAGTEPHLSTDGSGSPTPTPTPTPAPDAHAGAATYAATGGTGRTVAVTLVSLNQVSLSWSASAGATGYIVERSTDLAGTGLRSRRP